MWSGSSIFRAFIRDVLDNAADFDLGADTIKTALYNNSITPDADAPSADTAYNAGQWSNVNEVSEAGQWAAGGVALSNVVLDGSVSKVVFLDADDTSSGSAADLANVYGCLDYDDTLATPVADQGICFRYFGGANSVVNGTFTVVHHPNGIMRITLT